MKEIPFAGTIEKPHILRAMKLHLRYRKRHLVFASFFVVIFITALILDFDQYASAWPVMVFWILFNLFLYYMPAINTRSLFKSNRILQRGLSISGTASDAGLNTKSDYVTSNLPWDVFNHSRVRNDIVLLYVSKAEIHIFPRSFFANDDAWEAFIKLLKANVKVK